MMSTATTLPRTLATANGRHFVLGDPRATCLPEGMAGWVERRQNGWLFSMPDGAPFAFLVDTPRQGTFFVSCSKDQQGLRYMHALCSLDQDYLGVPNGFMAESDYAAASAKRLREIAE